MQNKTVPFSREQLDGILEAYPTPVYIYDEAGLRATARAFNNAFSWVEAGGFRNYFAVKACPNPHIMKVLHAEGFGADCSSLAELELADRTGMSGDEIILTSNDTPAGEFVRARELDAIINLDDITHLDFLERTAGLPERVCFRYNPGPLKAGNDIIGHPEEAKYGLTREQLTEAYRRARDKGVTRFGLHTMIVSNMLDVEYLVDTGRMLFELVAGLHKELGITFDFVNLGGGVGLAYRPEDEPVDLAAFGAGVEREYRRIIEPSGHPPLRVVLESGRAVSGPHGYLVSRVRHVVKKYRDYVGLDACMANLMRPALYGAYHHITVIGKEGAPRDHVYDVTGSLCENNDKFAVQRELPAIEPDDILVLHDAGAHGHAMGFQYNGKLRSAEVLLKEDGSAQLIRRAETLDDYFATLDFSTL